ncbi:MAG: electron transport complex subunit RsxC [Pseudomonadota bacterium]
MSKLFKFHGGIHPPEHKTQSTQLGIATAPLPGKLIIPFKQHAGEAAKPCVKVGDHVLKGQLIGEPQGPFSSAVHAPTSGTIAAIDFHAIAHASAMSDLCATLIPDGADTWISRHPLDYRNAGEDEIYETLRMAGIVGLGGATFPTDIKLRGKHHIQTLILNAAECEPYISCDDMLMRERAEEIIRGAEMLRHIIRAEDVVIGIEDNKPEAAAAMRQAITAEKLTFKVVVIPTLYPSGGVKQLIKILTGLEVPSGKLPNDVGVQCFNVATTYSTYRAIQYGEPLLSRIVTVTGNVRQPRNYEVLLGTPVGELLALGSVLPDTRRYIMGGPMMGIPLPSTEVPLVKASNCIIAASDTTLPPAPAALPCIRCTRCVEVCPAELQPQDLYWFAKAKDFDKTEKFSLFDCIECGACAYVCPSHIPLVDYYRFAKSEIRARSHEKQAADRARDRHEFREQRIEREKQEKAEKLAARERAAQEAKQKAAALAATETPPADDARQKIQAALAQAKQQAATVTPKNTEHLTARQQAEISAAEMLRAQAHQLAQADTAEQHKD